MYRRVLCNKCVYHLGGGLACGRDSETFALRHVLYSTFRGQIPGKRAETYAGDDADESPVRVLHEALQAKRVARGWEGV